MKSVLEGLKKGIKRKKIVSKKKLEME